jgi:hypothetical protein
LREEYRLRVFENRVLRKIFGPKRDEVAGDWRIMHNEEIYDLYYSPNIIPVIKSRRMRWTGHVARMGDMRGEYRVLVGGLEGERALRRPGHRWENNIKMGLEDMEWGGMDWSDLAQDRDRWRAPVNVVNEPSDSLKCDECLN